MERPTILVIEDDESIRTQMKWTLAKDYEVLLSTDGGRAMEIIKDELPPLVVLDLGLPPDPDGTSEGLRLLSEITGAAPSTKVIVVTGNPDKSAAMGAISRGAHDFFIKPIDTEALKAILKRSLYVYNLEAEYRSLQEKLDRERFSEMVGTSPGMQEVFATIRKVATTDVPVLVTGESGTGKELVARGIHSNSVRRDRPFVPINCGAIPENLLESELFGHEKGAFTGAHVQRAGRIELAQGGTLFLDEIGELPPQLQVKILRFLQDYEIERVGGRVQLDIDARVIAATNRDIKGLIREGMFREDLYYRLAVVTIHLPPLRARGEDILLIAMEFLKKICADKGRPKKLADDAVEAICSYSWPGNVRELENKMRRAVTFSEGPVITAGDMGIWESPARPEAGVFDLKKAREELDVRLIKTAMTRNKGNVSRAAVELGLTRPTLHHLLKKYSLTQSSFERIEKDAR